MTTIKMALLASFIISATAQASSGKSDLNCQSRLNQGMGKTKAEKASEAVRTVYGAAKQQPTKPSEAPKTNR